MKVSIFGATGALGRECTRQCLEAGHEVTVLEGRKDIAWLGIRPLQMRSGPERGAYRLGFDAFSGFSKITFADCAHAMIGMLDDDTWLHKAPIVQY